MGRRSAQISRGKKTIRALGFGMIATGLALMSNFVYENFVQNLVQSPEQVSTAQELYQQWQSLPAPSLTPGEIPVIQEKPEPAEVFATLRIPALGTDFIRPIGESTNLYSTLNKIGVGHYSDTQMPGEIGNFAVAGHRTTHGAVFMDLDKLKSGDLVQVDTKDGTYTYIVDSTQVVDPTDVWVIAPTPDPQKQEASERWLTMTTCTPKYSDTHRLIVWAKFYDFVPRG